MKIDRDIYKAIQAILYLDKQACLVIPVHWEYIGAAIGLERIPTMRILSPLVKADILFAMADTYGGYHLTRRAADITLLEVVEALQGDIKAHVYRGEDTDPFISAKLRIVSRKLTYAKRRLLDSIRISDFRVKLPKKE